MTKRIGKRVVSKKKKETSGRKKPVAEKILVWVFGKMAILSKKLDLWASASRQPLRILKWCWMHVQSSETFFRMNLTSLQYSQYWVCYSHFKILRANTLKSRRLGSQMTKYTCESNFLPCTCLSRYIESIYKRASPCTGPIWKYLLWRVDFSPFLTLQYRKWHICRCKYLVEHVDVKNFNWNSSIW